MWTPGPDRNPEHEMERENPGDEPGIEIGPNPHYRPPRDDPAEHEEGDLDDLAPKQPGERSQPTETHDE